MDQTKQQTTDYVRQLTDTLDGANWLDESYQKKLKNVTAENAFVRPHSEIHSIAELVAHTLNWKKHGIKKLQGVPSNLTVESPENWQSNDELKAVGWTNLKNDLFKTQEELTKLLLRNQDSFLLENQYADGYSYQFLVEGLIHHDIYHLGQIGITVKLLSLQV